MEAEGVLQLYDSCWFELEILKKNLSSSKSTSSEANRDEEIKQDSLKPKLSRIQTIHTRSMSDQLSSVTSLLDSFSPDSVLPPVAKLQTILSGKEVTDPEGENSAQIHHREALPKKNIATRRRTKGESKSLSELEFEELKGFMDLGFVFSEEDKDSSLASIIPGLQRLGKKEEEEEEGDFDESGFPRPYLSEAWEVQNKGKNPLMNWRVPALNNEIDMKDSLKWWAHTVASSVR